MEGCRPHPSTRHPPTPLGKRYAFPTARRPRRRLEARTTNTSPTAPMAISRAIRQKEAVSHRHQHALACGLGLLFFCGILLGISLALPGRSFWEALAEGLGPYFEKSQTRFAPALQEEVFSTIPLGSSQGRVLSLVGPPLSRRYCSHGTICWDYSLPYNSDASYLRRTLIFDRSGRLVNRYMGFVLGD
jgi:hypothetical protein